MRRKTFGGFFKNLRIEKRLTLRQFCKDHNLDPGNISRLERGLFPAPTSKDKLTQYAKALRIKKGTDNWYTFFDLAAAERGKFPADVLDDKAVIPKLPILFRTLRSKKISKKKLKELIRTIKAS